MKIVSLKNNTIIFLILTITFYSCRSDSKVELEEESVSMLAKLDTTGFFIEYPFVENKIYLLGCNDIQVELSKVLTNQDINFKMNIRYDKLEYLEVQLPIFREVIDFDPMIKQSLESKIEKLFFKTPENCFIVEFGYGTGDVVWNYLYQVDKNRGEVYLIDIFYSESIKNIIGNNPENEKDTMVYYCRFPINKAIEQTPYEYIDSLFHHFEKMNNKEEKWLIRERIQ